MSSKLVLPPHYRIPEGPISQLVLPDSYTKENINRANKKFSEFKAKTKLKPYSSHRRNLDLLENGDGFLVASYSLDNKRVKYPFNSTAPYTIKVVIRGHDKEYVAETWLDVKNHVPDREYDGEFIGAFTVPMPSSQIRLTDKEMELAYRCINDCTRAFTSQAEIFETKIPRRHLEYIAGEVTEALMIAFPRGVIESKGFYEWRAQEEQRKTREQTEFEAKDKIQDSAIIAVHGQGIPYNRRETERMNKHHKQGFGVGFALASVLALGMTSTFTNPAPTQRPTKPGQTLETTVQKTKIRSDKKFRQKHEIKPEEQRPFKERK